MIITNHAIERYTERVLKLKGVKKGKYIIENRNLIIQQIKKMIKSAKFLYRGWFNTQCCQSKYYQNGKYKFIVSLNDDKVITILDMSVSKKGKLIR